MKLISYVLDAVGVAALCVAAWLVTPVLGLALCGMIALLVAWVITPDKE
jgi:phosphate/sulfate permease